MTAFKFSAEEVFSGKTEETESIEFQPYKFILAGNATFTVESKITGKRFTYKVNKLDDLEKDLWFVGVLTGPDNNADYTYLGIIQNNRIFKRTAKSPISPDADSHKAFAWVWGKILAGANIEKQASIYHEGRCGRCGRKLTVPESIKSGFGPECREKV